MRREPDTCQDASAAVRLTFVCKEAGSERRLRGCGSHWVQS